MGKEIFKIVSSRKQRFIWFEGEINGQSARAFIKQLTKLNNDGSEPIFFYISGQGGFLNSFLNITIAIQNSTSKIFCVAHGLAQSAPFLLTQAVPTGFRFAVAGTKFQFHRTVDTLIKSIRAGAEFFQEDYLSVFKTLVRLDGLVLAMFFLKCKPECRDQITELQQREKVISVNKAIKLGIIDNYFDKKCFQKDQRIARALLKRRKSS